MNKWLVCTVSVYRLIKRWSICRAQGSIPCRDILLQLYLGPVNASGVSVALVFVSAYLHLVTHHPDAMGTGKTGAWDISLGHGGAMDLSHSAIP